MVDNLEMSIDKSLIYLNLIPGVGPQTIRQLLQNFESADEVLSLTLTDIESLKIPANKHALRRILYEKRQISIDREIELIQEHDCQVVAFTNSSYPSSLKEIPDPPLILYFKGKIPPHVVPWLSIVGTREPTIRNKEICYELASQCAKQGATIVSGGAEGVDTAAHRGVLDVKGKTVSVIACGLSQVYSFENQDLMTEIIQNGAVISEFPMAVKPKPMNFSQRNRLISGLSRETLVVEASARSGSLITARLALEQGRKVFTLSGPLPSSTIRATHRLINQGAKLVQSVEDMLGVLPHYFDNQPNPEDPQSVQADQLKPDNLQKPNPEFKKENSDAEITKPDGHSPERASQSSKLSPQEKLILSAIGNGEQSGVHIDHIARTTGLPVHIIAGVLTMMELQSLVIQLPGMNFICQRDN